MTLRCTICKLDPTKRGVIDSALRGGASLQTVADKNGLKKSAVWRHGRHVVGYNAAAGSNPRPTRAVVTKSENSGPQTSAQSTAVVPPARVQPAPALADRETALNEALSRAELLFAEALAGLEAAKQTITVSKGDGTVVEIPGDLRARAAFIRVAESVADQLARLRGLFEQPLDPYAGVTISQVILFPKVTDARTSQSIERVVDGSVEPPTGS